MQIILMDKIYECDNQIEAVKAVLEEVNQMLAKSEQKLSCLEIDGAEVYDNHIQYIIEQLATINTILVKVKPLPELLADTFISIQEYLERAIPEVNKLADEFSQEIGQSTWNNFSQLMEGLRFIFDMLEVIDAHQELCYNALQFGTIRANMVEAITVLQEATETQDRVSLSDILRYEIVPLLEKLNNEITRKEH